jgi:hypothetical protein
VRENQEKIKKRIFYDARWKKGMSLVDIKAEWEVDVIICLLFKSVIVFVVCSRLIKVKVERERRMRKKKKKKSWKMKRKG